MLKLLITLTVFIIVTFLAKKLVLRLCEAGRKPKKEKTAFNPGLVFSGLTRITVPKKFISYKILSALAAFTAVMLLTGAAPLAVPFGIIGFFLPGAAVNRAKKNYIDKFNSQLMDALNIISGSLRAGTSFNQALETVAQKSKAPLSAEFSRANNDIKLGVPLNEALTGLSDRVGSSDLNLFITTVNIARETGGNLPEILDIITVTMRERNKVQGKINALTAQGKMSGYVVGSMPFILIAIFYLMSPEMIAPMFTTLPGQLMLAVIVIMVLTGGLLIRKIVTIDI